MSACSTRRASRALKRIALSTSMIRLMWPFTATANISNCLSITKVASWSPAKWKCRTHSITALWNFVISMNFSSTANCSALSTTIHLSNQVRRNWLHWQPVSEQPGPGVVRNSSAKGLIKSACWRLKVLLLSLHSMIKNTITIRYVIWVQMSFWSYLCVFLFVQNDHNQLDDFGRGLLHGKGYDRWFDKSFTLVIGKNGRVWINSFNFVLLTLTC